MRSMDKFCADDIDQLTYYQKVGYFSGIPEVYAGLDAIVSGKKLGRGNPEERIMAMNLGLAIEDLATATHIYKEAEKTGVGRRLPL